MLSRQTALAAVNDIPVLLAAMDYDLLLALLQDPEVYVHLAVAIMFYKHVVECTDPFFHIFMTICHKRYSL